MKIAETIVRRQWGVWVGGLLLVLIAIELAWGLRQFSSREKMQRRLDSAIRTLRTFEAVRPAPTLEQSTRLDEQAAQAEDVVRRLQGKLAPAAMAERPLESGGSPAAGLRAGVYFDLAQFVDEVRAMAREENVEIGDTETLSFSCYAHHGPEPEVQEMVLRQRRALADLLMILFDARPTSLDGVRRETPLSVEGSRLPADFRSVGSVAGATLGPDLFTLDPRVSQRRRGPRAELMLHTLAFRLMFSGSTSTLRDFLNRLARAPSSWMVCSVEAGPAATRRSSAGASVRTGGNGVESASSNEPVPTIAPVPVQFVVTVELVEPRGVVAVGSEGAS